MSAGGLSYSGLTNYGSVTLPSVDTWGTDMNILRDPPRSITTRRIDKVGETSDITAMIDDSGNRSCEAIQVYARGVNPSVSVSYSNYGNNGGQGQAGGLTGLNAPIAGAGRQAKLPFSVMKDGAFRPPVRTQFDLMPLSRIPRIWTSAYSQPGFADYSKKMRTCGTAAETKEVFDTTLTACARPTAVYKIEKPHESQQALISKSIQDTMINPASSGIRTMDITQQEVKVPLGEIYNDRVKTDAYANISDNSKYINSSKKATGNYIQDTNHQNVQGNLMLPNKSNLEDVVDMGSIRARDDNLNMYDINAAVSKRGGNDLDVMVDTSNMPLQESINTSCSAAVSRNQGTTSIESILDLSDMPIKEVTIIDHVAPHSRSGDGTTYMHSGDGMVLERVLPEHSMETNFANPTKYIHQEHSNIELERNVPSYEFASNPMRQGMVDNGSREARLLQKINPGGFEGKAQLPDMNRAQNNPTLQNAGKMSLSQSVMNEMDARYAHRAPFA